MSNYSTKRNNIRKAELADVVADNKRDSLLRRIRSDVLNQPRYLQDYDREIAELDRLFGEAVKAEKPEAMKAYNKAAVELGLEYIERWEEWQEDLAYLETGDCTCTPVSGACHYCSVSAKVKR